MSMNLPSITEPILSLSGVTLGYPGKIALSNVTCHIQPGDFVGIIGPNGSGKSTLLKGILGLIPVLEGKIEIFGSSQQKLVDFRRNIGYVAQKNKSEYKFPALVKEVVAMGLYAKVGWFRQLKPFHWEAVARSLELVKMAEYAEHPFRDLSGGQQQRVIIARALVADARLLILDEPTNAVDITAQHVILEILEKLNKENGITILIVTHDINEIIHFCDKVILLGDNQSRCGRPEEVLTRDNLVSIYGDRVIVYEHHGHPHILVGDFHL